MFKKIIISSLFLIATWSTFAGHEPVPYENVIAREYNRMRGGADRYSSIHAIMNQTLRGRSVEQKNQMIADLKSLKHAVDAALEQAKHDGQRMWYWGYIWKDNEPAIQTLAQYGYDITNKLADCEMQLQSDIVKLFWYTSGVTSGALLGITALYLSQHYLSKERFMRDSNHGLFEMLAAPTLAGLDVAAIGAKSLLALIISGTEGLKNAADKALSIMKEIPPVTPIPK